MRVQPFLEGVVQAGLPAGASGLEGGEDVRVQPNGGGLLAAGRLGPADPGEERRKLRGGHGLGVRVRQRGGSDAGVFRG